MFDRLDDILTRYREIEAQLADPGTASDAAEMQRLLRERASIADIAETYGKYLENENALRDGEVMLSAEKDPEMRGLIEEEQAALTETREELSGKLRILLIPKDPDDTRNAIVEIRAGAGGDEAALFAADLFRMYSRYADRKGWRTEMISLSENGIGGFKECTFRIAGRDVWSRLKYESGTHRVQRVPETESGGRIHTSTATVAIMPEAEEIDVTVDPADVRIDVFRASGNGGQCVNTTDSAVRLTHIPTGIVISCQDEKSQIKNKAKAMQVLRTKLYDLERRRQQEERADLRRSQVGTGDRSEKIRTYNFPQGRVSDHRIHLTVHRIQEILGGDLDEIVDALTAEEQAEKLAAMNGAGEKG